MPLQVSTASNSSAQSGGRVKDPRFLRRRKVVLDFFATTSVGRGVPDEADEDFQRKLSEWELRDWEAREEERRRSDEQMGVIFVLSYSHVAYLDYSGVPF
jgi:hypothetical protein